MMKANGMLEGTRATWMPENGGTSLATLHHSASGRTLGQYQGLCERLLQVKQACANANLQSRTISTDEHEQITRAIAQLTSSPSSSDFPVDALQGGGAIAINTNLNERIACIIEFARYKEWAAKINTNQSTADVCATAIRLSVRDELSTLAVVLDRSVEVLQKFARDNQRIWSMARTCMRDAMPVAISENGDW